MNRTVCCKHHLCGECASEIMERIPAFRAGYEETGTVREAKPAPCPHCGAESMRLAKIRSHEEARNYSDSPAVMSRMRGSTATPGRVAVQASPLKVGDSMENLMRKMLTYEQCGINIKAEQRITVVGDMTTPGRPGSESPPLCDRVELDANNLPNVPFLCPLPEDRAHNPALAPECREDGDAAERRASSEALSDTAHVPGSGREGGGMMLMAPVDMRGKLPGAERERERELPGAERERERVEGVVPGRPPLHGSRNFSRSRSISPLPVLSADATASFGGESFGGGAGSVFLCKSPGPEPAAVAEIAPIARIAWSVNVAEALGGAAGVGGRSGEAVS
jgi:hypothetical protein